MARTTRLSNKQLRLATIEASLNGAFGGELTADEVRAVAAKNVRLSRRMLLDGFKLAFSIPQFDHIENTAPARELFENGQAFVIATLHFGPFFLLPMALGKERIGGRVVLHPAFLKFRKRSIERRARKLGTWVELVAMNDLPGLVRMRRGLGQGEPAMILVDEGYGLGGDRERARRVPFELFGQPMHARSAAADLARRAGVPLVAGLAFWDADGGRSACFSNPIDSSDPTTAMRALWQWFEPHLKAHPEQWEYWSHPQLLWRPSAATPGATREDFDRAVAGAREKLERGEARLTTEPMRFAFQRQKDGKQFVIDAQQRRVLRFDQRGAFALDAAMCSIPATELVAGLGGASDESAEAVARLELAGLVRWAP